MKSNKKSYLKNLINQVFGRIEKVLLEKEDDNSENISKEQREELNKGTQKVKELNNEFFESLYVKTKEKDISKKEKDRIKENEKEKDDQIEILK